MDQLSLKRIVMPLVTWYQKEQRDLPWRHNVTPYRVWVSEIMLQQTRVETVKEYYVRFLKRLPDIKSLAEVPEDELLKLWEGLGYYSRVRNMQKAAKEIMEEYDGVFPDDYESIHSLPGIGDYTAGAICAFAYHLPYPAVDGNVLRVLSRIVGSRLDIKEEKTKEVFRQAIRQVLTSQNVSDFDQGLMELGATVCLPNGEPLCHQCPLQKYCQAYQLQLTDELPVKALQRKRKVIKKTILLLRCGDFFAIRKRAEPGLLQGLYEFPNCEGNLSKRDVEKVVSKATKIKPLTKAKHIFTHIEWHMIGFLVEVATMDQNYLWVTKEELDTYSIPTAFQKYHPQNLQI